MHVNKTGVATNKSAIRRRAAVGILFKIVLVFGYKFASNLVNASVFKLYYACRIFGSDGQPKIKIFGIVFNVDIFGVMIHCAAVTVNYTVLITCWIFDTYKWNTCQSRKPFGGVISPEWKPVMVGAGIDIFIGVLTQNCVNINTMHILVGISKHIIYGRILLWCKSIVFGTVKRCRSGNWHQPNVHFVAKGLFVKIRHLGIFRRCVLNTFPRRKRTNIFAATCYRHTVPHFETHVWTYNILILRHNAVFYRIVVSRLRIGCKTYW